MQDFTSLADCSQNSLTHGRNCWAEIDLNALKRNAHLLGSLGPALMAVLKADAYGHGIEIVAPALAASGVRRFGIATADEGEQLRRLVGPEPELFVMTTAPPEDAPQLVRHRLTPFVSSRELLDALSRAAEAECRIAAVHLEIDTGIGRAGFEPDDFAGALDYAMKLPGVRVAGLCTHFTSGEDAEDAKGQQLAFERILRERVPDDLLQRVVIHAANSPALLNVPGARYGMIRPGLLLYGISPGGDEGARIASPEGASLTLAPVLSLHARVLLVRELPAGAPISYGRTYHLERAARIATVGIGYGDGYSRRFSNIGQVLLPDGISAPVRGRVCMDQCCVELPPGSRVAACDIVTLVGESESSGNQLRAAQIAAWIDATPHEVTTCLTGRVPRIAVGSSAEE